MPLPPAVACSIDHEEERPGGGAQAGARQQCRRHGDRRRQCTFDIGPLAMVERDWSRGGAGGVTGPQGRKLHILTLTLIPIHRPVAFGLAPPIYRPWRCPSGACSRSRRRTRGRRCGHIHDGTVSVCLLLHSLFLYCSILGSTYCAHVLGCIVYLNPVCTSQASLQHPHQAGSGLARSTNSQGQPPIGTTIAQLPMALALALAAATRGAGAAMESASSDLDSE